MPEARTWELIDEEESNLAGTYFAEAALAEDPVETKGVLIDGPLLEPFPLHVAEEVDGVEELLEGCIGEERPHLSTTERSFVVSTRLTR